MNAQMSQNLASWGVPTAVSLLFTVVGGAVLWGQYSQRIAALETSQRDAVRLEAETVTRISVHDTQIALINQKLDTIIQQLATANAKLDTRAK